MKPYRTCESSQLHTGASKCAPNFEIMRGAILMAPGQKLPADLTADELEKLVHADLPNRAYVIVRFAEYAKNGGEVQTAANGYDGERPTGVSARKDTFTLNAFNPILDASLTEGFNQERDVYFFDGDNILYGIDDGTDEMAGYPMNSVYSDTTPFRTSSASPTQTITFVHSDAKVAKTKFQFRKLAFNINSKSLVTGLIPVEIVPTSDGNGTFKILEQIGGYDVTAIYGPLLVAAGEDVVLAPASAITYNSKDKTIECAGGNTVPRIAQPSVLLEKGIKGIEQV